MVLNIRISSLFWIFCALILVSGTASADNGWSVHADCNTIKSMAASGTVIWYAAESGQFRFHTDTGAVEQFGPKEAGFTSKVKIAPDGTPWMISQGSLAFFRDNEFHVMAEDGTPSSEPVTDYDFGPDNSLWVGTTGGLYHLVGSVWNPVDFTYGVVTSIAVDGLGRVWVGCVTMNQYKVASAADCIPGERDPSVSGFTRKPTGDHAYPSAIYVYDGSEWTQFANFASSYNPSISLKAWKKDEMFAWRPDYGLLYYHGSECTRITSANGLPGDIIAMDFGPDGSPWVGTTYGICRLSIDDTFSVTTKTYTISDGLPSNNILSIVSTRDGRVFAGTEYGFGVYENSRWSSIRLPGPIGWNFSQTVRDSDNIMWFGSEKGISRFQNGTWKTYTAADGLTGNQITNLWLDSKGRVWYSAVGAVGFFENGKVTSWPIDGERFTPPLPLDDGSTWLGTDTSLLRVDEHGPVQKFTFYNHGTDRLEKGADGSIWAIVRRGNDARELYRYRDKEDAGTLVDSYGNVTPWLQSAPDHSM